MDANRLRVLVIDDEPDIAKMLARACEAAGYKAQSTTSPDEFRTLALTKPDFIAMDLMMPKTDGVELFRYLAENHVEAPLLLVSGSDHRVLQSAARLAESQGLAVLGTLSKPFTPAGVADLLARVKRMPAQARLSDGNVITDDELASAIAKGEVVAYFQPQVDLLTGAAVGCEALARWVHPQWGLVFPDRFIPIAEKSGLMGPLTDCISKQAIKQCAALGLVGIDIHFSINVSAISLTDIAFPDKLLCALEERKVRPEQIVIEITESTFFEDPVKTLDVLTRLRMKGIGLSIDDFGTGYSTFSQLQRNPFNELKIDKEFVIMCETNKESQSIVRTAIDLAQRLGIRTVAEGVESFGVAGRLSDWGCQIAQGYAYSRALPPAAFSEWMLSRPSG